MIRPSLVGAPAARSVLTELTFNLLLEKITHLSRAIPCASGILHGF